MFFTTCCEQPPHTVFASTLLNELFLKKGCILSLILLAHPKIATCKLQIQAVNKRQQKPRTNTRKCVMVCFSGKCNECMQKEKRWLKSIKILFQGFFYVWYLCLRTRDTFSLSQVHLCGGGSLVSFAFSQVTAEHSVRYFGKQEIFHIKL